MTHNVMLEKQVFSRQDTAIFKGIAILMIIVHNYLHFQQGFFLENEATFNPKNVRDFFAFMYPLRWYESFSAVAAFLLHYGVQLFIFFSVYGLAMQMKKNENSFRYLFYVWTRLKKLYFLLFFGVVVFLVVRYFTTGSFYGFARTIKELFMLMTSAANFRNSTLYSSFSGPFWFFGLMVQLYLLFPFIYKLVKRVNLYVLLFVTLILVSGLYFIDRKTDFSVFGTLIGHLPEVVLGVYFAQKGITKPNVLLFLFSVFLFIASQFYGTLFPLSFLAISIILLYLVETLKPFINDYFTRTIIYIGEISMILFIVNGPLRHIPFFNPSNVELRAERVFLFLIVLFMLSHFLYKLYTYITTKLKI